MSRFDCPGEEAAYNAGKEAPLCYFCDAPIEELSELRMTSGGKPVCESCDEDIRNRVEEKRQKSAAEFAQFSAHLCVSYRRKSLNFHE